MNSKRTVVVVSCTLLTFLGSAPGLDALRTRLLLRPLLPRALPQAHNGSWLTLPDAVERRRDAMPYRKLPEDLVKDHPQLKNWEYRYLDSDPPIPMPSLGEALSTVELSRVPPWDKLVVVEDGSSYRVSTLTQVIDDRLRDLRKVVKAKTVAFGDFRRAVSILGDLLNLVTDHFREQSDYQRLARDQLDVVRTRVQSSLAAQDIRLKALEREISLYRWAVLGLLGLLGVNVFLRLRHRDASSQSEQSDG